VGAPRRRHRAPPCIPVAASLHKTLRCTPRMNRCASCPRSPSFTCALTSNKSTLTLNPSALFTLTSPPPPSAPYAHCPKPPRSDVHVLSRDQRAHALHFSPRSPRFPRSPRLTRPPKPYAHESRPHVHVSTRKITRKNATLNSKIITQKMFSNE
jgi:hypothetical protein